MGRSEGKLSVDGGGGGGLASSYSATVDPASHRKGLGERTRRSTILSVREREQKREIKVCRGTKVLSISPGESGTGGGDRLISYRARESERGAARASSRIPNYRTLFLALDNDSSIAIASMEVHYRAPPIWGSGRLYREYCTHMRRRKKTRGISAGNLVHAGTRGFSASIESPQFLPLILRVTLLNRD